MWSLLCTHAPPPRNHCRPVYKCGSAQGHSHKWSFSLHAPLLEKRVPGDKLSSLSCPRCPQQIILSLDNSPLHFPVDLTFLSPASYFPYCAPTIRTPASSRKEESHWRAEVIVLLPNPDSPHINTSEIQCPSSLVAPLPAMFCPLQGGPTKWPCPLSVA